MDEKETDQGENEPDATTICVQSNEGEKEVQSSEEARDSHQATEKDRKDEKEGTVHVSNARSNDVHNLEERFDSLRFHNQLVDLVDECRRHRIAVKDYDLKIRHLLEEKRELEVKLEDAEIRIKKIDNECREKIALREKQFKIQEKEIEFDKDKFNLAIDAHQKESRSLKEDIRNLQHSRYSYEKKIKEQELLLESYEKSKSYCISQISKLEERIKELTADLTQLKENISSAEITVVEVMKINEEFTRVNLKQLHQIKAQETRIKELEGQLKKSRINIGTLPASFKEELATKNKEIEILVLKLNQRKSELDGVNMKLNDSRAEKNEVEKTLVEAHSLLDRHIESNSRLEKEKKELAKVVESLREEVALLNKGFNEKSKDLDVEKETFASAMQGWKKVEEKLESDLSDAHRTIESYKEKQKQLEALNLEWTEKYDSMKKELGKLNDELNKPKGVAETQTEIAVRDVHVQAVAPYVTTTCQTSFPVRSASCQAVAETSSSSAQAEVLCETVSAQTEPPPQHHTSTGVQEEFLPVPPDTSDAISQTCLSFASCMKPESKTVADKSESLPSAEKREENTKPQESPSRESQINPLSSFQNSPSALGASEPKRRRLEEDAAVVPPTSIAPPSIAPPSIAPPTMAPPTIASPAMAPPTMAPPPVAPPPKASPPVAPPTMAPPAMAPPSMAPSAMAPPHMVPPTMAPPTMAPPPPRMAPPTVGLDMPRAAPHLKQPQITEKDTIIPSGLSGNVTTRYPADPPGFPAAPKRILERPSFRFLDEDDLVPASPVIPILPSPSRPESARKINKQPSKQGRRVRFADNLELTPPSSQETAERRARAWSVVGAGHNPRRQAPSLPQVRNPRRQAPSIPQINCLTGQEDIGDHSLFSEDEESFELGSQMDKIDELLNSESVKLNRRLSTKKK